LQPNVQCLEERALLTAPANVPIPADTPSQDFYSPAQIRHAYGVDQIKLSNPGGGTIQGDGLGQTIAIIEQGNDPTVAQDLNVFDSNFGLTSSGQSLYQQYGQASSFLTILNEYGQPSPLPATDNGTVDETALDVEWAHAIAPGAKILLVEAWSPLDLEHADPKDPAHVQDFFRAVQYAGGVPGVPGVPGVSVISMSYGFPDWIMPEPGTNYDSDLTAPGVTYVVSSGDQGEYVFNAEGQYTTIGLAYPAESPNVLAVGGTTLHNLDAQGDYPGTGPNGEIGWQFGSDTGLSYGNADILASGGGISNYEPEPAYQRTVQQTGYREVPDVAFDADPATGTWAYDSADGWYVANGTSLASPCWAGLIAIVDQGLALQNHPSIDGATQTLPAIYRLPPTDFHDIVYGNNGYQAEVGYDLVTGRGSPIANQLVPDLINTFLVKIKGDPITASAGVVFNGPVASFAVNDPARVPANYTATINWGDGTPTTIGTILPNTSGGYDVVGQHVYSYVAPGTTFPVTVTLTDVTGYRTVGTGNAVVISSDLVYGRGVKIQMNARQQFAGKVATFTGYDPSNSVGDFSAVIAWGDGTYTKGMIMVDPSGGFEVWGTKTYSRAGTYRVWVTISGGSGAFVPDTVRVSASRPLVTQSAPNHSGSHGLPNLLSVTKTKGSTHHHPILLGKRGNQP